MLGHTLGVLLAQGAQLLVHGAVQLLARDSLGDAGLGQLRLLRRQAWAAAPLGVVERPGPTLAVLATAVLATAALATALRAAASSGATTATTLVRPPAGASWAPATAAGAATGEPAASALSARASGATS
ncbi:hypothetical protein GCM10027517_25760 [Phycicoccus ginsengisoli]